MTSSVEPTATFRNTCRFGRQRNLAQRRLSGSLLTSGRGQLYRRVRPFSAIQPSGREWLFLPLSVLLGQQRNRVSDGRASSPGIGREIFDDYSSSGSSYWRRLISLSCSARRCSAAILCSNRRTNLRAKLLTFGRASVSHVSICAFLDRYVSTKPNSPLITPVL